MKKLSKGRHCVIIFLIESLKDKIYEAGLVIKILYLDTQYYDK